MFENLFSLTDEESFFKDYLEMGENEFALCLDMFLPSGSVVLIVEYDDTDLSVEILVCVGVTNVQIQIELEVGHEESPQDFIKRYVAAAQIECSNTIFQLLE